MSQWNHAICERDWIDKSGTWEPRPDIAPDAVELVEICRPVVLKEPPLEICCFCREPTIFGAYVRQDPTKVPCNGNHALASSPPSTRTEKGE